MTASAVILAAAGEAAAQEDGTPFLVAPAIEGVVLRWAWPEGERPLGYHVERREPGGGWTRLTAQPIARVRARAEARMRIGDAFDRYEAMLFPTDPLEELRDPESYRSLLLLLADVEPDVARVLGLRYDDRAARVGGVFEYRLIGVTRRGETEIAGGGPVVAGSFQPAAGPDSLQVLQQAEAVTLRWSIVGAFTAYHVFRRLGSRGEWARLNAGPVVVFTDPDGSGTDAAPHYFRDSTAQTGDTVTYAVAGIDPFGRLSARSAEVSIVVRDVVPPDPPQQITTRVRGDTIVVSWVGSPDPAVAGYRVWRAAARDGTFEPVGAPLPPGARSATDVGRPAGRPWWYYVTATDAAGNESGPSFMAIAEIPDLEPPGTPNGVRGTGETGRLSLAWTAVTAPDLRGYRVYRAYSPSGEFALITEAPIPVARFTDSVRAGADHAFYYRVTAVDSAYNESRPSATVAVSPPDVTPPSAPQIASVTSGEGMVIVAWVGNPEPDVRWYRVRHRLRGREMWMERRDSVAAPRTTDTIPGLPPGELLEVSVVAVDDAGNRSLPARPVTARAFKRRPPPAVAIRRVRFDRSRSSVIVEWVAPPAEITRVMVLRRRDRDSTWTEVGAAPPGALRLEDRVLPEARRIEYVVRALDRFGNAADSRRHGVSIPREER